MKEKGYTKKNFLKGIIAENPLFVSILVTCPALATTKSVEAALGMGLLFTTVLICSNVLVSLFAPKLAFVAIVKTDESKE